MENLLTMSPFLSSNCKARALCSLASLVLLFALFLPDQSLAERYAKQKHEVIDIGVILDFNSLVGKEMLTAIEVACQDDRKTSVDCRKLQLQPHFVNSHEDPQQALSSANELIRKAKVQVILWLDTWQGEAIVSEISTRYRLPVISFAIVEKSPLRVRMNSNDHKEFQLKFVNKFRQIYGTSELRNFSPSINALKAYDCITAIVKSIDRTYCRILPRKITEVEFMGLSGPINQQNLQIFAIHGKKVGGLRSWTPRNESFRRFLGGQQEKARGKEAQILGASKPHKIKIGVPQNTIFNIFVGEVTDETTRKKEYEGLCIDVFYEALQHVNVPGFDYEFEPHNGTYDELVEKVRNQTYDGAVGDITILVNRSKVVEFTRPFLDSSLSMIVPVKLDSEKKFLFTKPFTPVMWAASAGVLLYTVFIVWALEHRSNQEFAGPWDRQLSTALWFTFSSLFFAHREQIHQTLSRIVLVIWFFVALILTQSYTASLTSMLTLQNIQPSVTTIEWLKAHHAVVRCDNKTFVCNYLIDEQKFGKDAILSISDSSSYGDHFRNGSISALFLEKPYEKAFSTRYCQGYVVSELSYRFGGFGFVFPKGSSLADDFSLAILELSERGELSRLQSKWFAPECISGNTTVIDTTPSLGIGSFWVLYVLTIATSTCCLLLSCLCVRMQRGYARNESSEMGNLPREMI